MRPRLPSRRFPLWALLWTLSGCSVRIDDAEEEARQRIEKQVEVTTASLAGLFIGDSTFRAFETAVTRFPASAAPTLEFFPDSTVEMKEAGTGLFPGSVFGRYRLGRDTLYLPMQGNDSRRVRVRLRFRGNYLETFEPATERYAFFHRRKYRDSLDLEALYAGKPSLWQSRGRRPSPTAPSAPAADSAPVTARIPPWPAGFFRFLRLGGDSALLETARKGRVESLASALSADGPYRIRLDSAGRAVRFEVQRPGPDSLRLWRLDSAGRRLDLETFSLLSGYPEEYLAVTPLTGYWRLDSAVLGDRWIPAHPGRFYDLDIGADYRITMAAAFEALPLFESWSAEGRLLRLRLLRASAGSVPPAGDSVIDFTVFHFRGDSLELRPAKPGFFFPAPSRLLFTRIARPDFAANPLSRFPKAPYLHLVRGGDTARFYFEANYSRVDLDRYEIAARREARFEWLALALDPDREIQGSGQKGFFFSFEGQAGGAPAVFAARQGLEFTWRSFPGAESGFIEGIFSGQVARVTPRSPSDSLAQDSVPSLSGSFRFRKRPLGVLKAPLWR